MMIRSGRIPPVLSRICSEGIRASMLVTTDGELLGTSYPLPDDLKDISEVSTLLTEISADYRRLGQELVLLDTSISSSHHQHADDDDDDTMHTTTPKSSLKYIEMELEQGLVGVCTTNVDCLIMAIATPDTPSGLLKARLEALAHHVQEALTPLTEPT